MRSFAVFLIPILLGCPQEKTTPPPPPPVEAPPPVEPAKAPPEKRTTTSGHIAVKNLDHQIANVGLRTKAVPNDPRLKKQLVELMLMKSQLLGVHASFDDAMKVVAQADMNTAAGRMLRARVLASLHRWGEAQKDLDKAKALGADSFRVESAEASILTATGRPTEALAFRKKAVERAATYGTLTGLASTLAALGRFEEAEKAYLDGLDALPGTSPFGVAWIHFTRGVMWSERAGDEKRGRALYELALEHLPQYAVANVHLAEIEAESGARDKAIARLEAILDQVDDPEPAGLLGELYTAAGRKEEGAAMIAKARARYEELLKAYPLAFADHAAEFFMGPGEDPARALKLAQQNLDNRETERSLSLTIRAARAAKADPCPFVAKAKAKPRTGVELDGLLDGCP